MTTGEGIFWATIVGLVVAGIYFATKKKKWRVVGIIIGILVLIGVAISGGVYLYGVYQTRATPQTKLFNIALGASPVEVRLALGEPQYQFVATSSNSVETLSYLYREYSWSDDIDKFIRFKKSEGEYKMSFICDYALSEGLFDFYSWVSKEEVIKKLGNPTSESIKADGLRKMLYFKKFNISVEIEKGKINTYCVTNEPITYVAEYKGEEI